ncbi:MAG: ATP-binding protein [Nostocaceae cyanobacterium]|nr:ATP-binding protein [Nostocaceae cyanobacterium]
MQLVIFIGLQASGKSTFFRTHFADTHAHISKDLMRNNKNKNRKQAELIAAAFEAERSVVVDNTNPTVEDRTKLISLGQAYGVQIIGYYFGSRVSDCLQRNHQRSGKAKVPEVGIYATAKKLVVPTFSEGFNNLFYVQIDTSGTFEITPWFDAQLIS